MFLDVAVHTLAHVGIHDLFIMHLNHKHLSDTINYRPDIKINGCRMLIYGCCPNQQNASVCENGEQ